MLTTWTIIDSPLLPFISDFVSVFGLWKQINSVLSLPRHTPSLCITLTHTHTRKKPPDTNHLFQYINKRFLRFFGNIYDSLSLTNGTLVGQGISRFLAFLQIPILSIHPGAEHDWFSNRWAGLRRNKNMGPPGCVYVLVFHGMFYSSVCMCECVATFALSCTH